MNQNIERNNQVITSSNRACQARLTVLLVICMIGLADFYQKNCLETAQFSRPQACELVVPTYRILFRILIDAYAQHL